MRERLQKLLSRYGVASRRAAESLLLDGRVRVNGEVAGLGDTAEDGVDQIQVDGVLLGAAPEKVYIMLNKPRGYVTTMRDEKGRKTVAELVADCGERVYPVGRLDMDSEGLLLLTNDGALANGLMHPRQEVEKRYRVWIADATEQGLRALAAPMVLDGYRIRPARVRVLWKQEDRALVEMGIHEGRNRQIRHMCQQAGMRVERLRRIAEGPVSLGRLPAGAWRPLEAEELHCLRQAAFGGGNGIPSCK